MLQKHLKWPGEGMPIGVEKEQSEKKTPKVRKPME